MEHPNCHSQMGRAWPSRAITWLAIVINTAVVTLMTDPWNWMAMLPMPMVQCRDVQRCATKGKLHDGFPTMFRMCCFLFGLDLRIFKRQICGGLPEFPAFHGPRIGWSRTASKAQLASICWPFMGFCAGHQDQIGFSGWGFHRFSRTRERCDGPQNYGGSWFAPIVTWRNSLHGVMAFGPGLKSFRGWTADPKSFSNSSFFALAGWI